MLPAIVGRAARPGAFTAVPVRVHDRSERLVVGTGFLERRAQREAQARLVGWRNAGERERAPQPLDDRGVGTRGGLQAGVARQCLVAMGIEGQDALVERQRVVPLAEVFPEVAEIEQGGHEIGIQAQRRTQLDRGVGVAAQVVRIDHAPVQVRFLGLRYAAVERLLVRGQG